MDPKTVSALNRLRLVSMPEAISWLLLIVSSVLKRTTDFNAVPVVGAVHGFLFIAYVLVWLDAWNRAKWPLGRAALYFGLSLVPGGGFYAEKLLRREVAEAAAPAPAAEPQPAAKQ
ncbi:DUF3817 domain-containing protein [Streptomyces alkaliterrae]|uniref:DUF3817 domain-containing protein n=1 Tax=Streptomyces alkaliterrae TaxID=2213162 RepID=A0A5P0YWC2_9ACTN|nr:DUF3817 domain-containing protein [Streptomyces alkaliterrae]MBB1252133.1 DUF3817 domain-containing protein [Streptomyces alkaliterrae]MBB1257557.1 DUF3817 domain-containing protein [Streptomyces alkaliterrae]MQS04583.1 DUF3817 domain-containing protein [Streptomyces alkaliterrae]